MAEVLGSIAAIIAITTATRQVYKQAKNTHESPEAFGVVVDQIPLVQKILGSAQELYPKTGTAHDADIDALLKRCKRQVSDLEELFKKIFAEDSAGLAERCKKHMKNFFRDRKEKVEGIWASVIRSLQLLDNYAGFKGLNAHVRLADALAVIEEVDDSLRTSDGGITINNEGEHSGAGNTFNTGSGTTESYHSYAAGYTGKGYTVNNHYPKKVSHYPLSEAEQDENFLQMLMKTSVTAVRTLEQARDKSRNGRTPGTCQWMLDHDSYHRWRKEPGPQILLIDGEPGIGKTMMSTFLIDHLKPKKPTDHLLVYFFCSNGEEKQNTAVAVLQGLLHHLLSQRPSFAHSASRALRTTGPEAVTDLLILWNTFESVIAQIDAPEVVVIVDGLDECEESGRDDLINRFDGLLRDPCESLSARLRAIITCRSHVAQQFWDGRRAFLRIKMDVDRIRPDLYCFITHEVRAISRSWSHETTEEVRSTLMRQSSGTFLWAALVLRRLARVARSRPDRVIHELHRIPPTLHALYSRILNEIDNNDEELVALSLSHLIAAPNLLTTTELATLAYFTSKWSERPRQLPTAGQIHDLAEAVSICPLLRTRVYMGITYVYFIHISAEEYPTNEDPSADQDRFRIGKVEAQEKLLQAINAYSGAFEIFSMAWDMKLMRTAMTSRGSDWYDCTLCESAVALGSVAETIKHMHYPLQCDGCEKSIGGSYSHCEICNQGNYDLCRDCVAEGKLCPGKKHKLAQRAAPGAFRTPGALRDDGISPHRMWTTWSHIKSSQLDLLRYISKAFEHDEKQDPGFGALLAELITNGQHGHDDDTRLPGYASEIKEALNRNWTHVVVLLLKVSFIKVRPGEESQLPQASFESYLWDLLYYVAIERPRQDILNVILDFYSNENVREYIIQPKVSAIATPIGGLVARLCADPRIAETTMKLILDRFRPYVGLVQTQEMALLHYLAASGAAKAMQLCIDHGDDIHTVDWFRHTPLHHAVRLKPSLVYVDGYAYICPADPVNDVAKVLLDKDNSGQRILYKGNLEWNTPLHVAVIAGWFSSVRLLETADEHKTTLFTKNRNEQTPLQLAKYVLTHGSDFGDSRCAKDIVSYLEQATADASPREIKYPEELWVPVAEGIRKVMRDAPPRERLVQAFGPTFVQINEELQRESKTRQLR